MSNSCGTDFLTGKKKFDDPFLLPSSDAIPDKSGDVWDFCQFVYFMNPIYVRASQRIVRHFIKDLVFPGDGSSKEKEELEEYLLYDLDIFQTLMELGDDERVYGNSFYRMYYPFRRFLIDEAKGKKYSVSMFPEEDIKFDIKTLTYEVTDPATYTSHKKSRIKLPFKDFKDTDIKKVRPIKINPREIIIIKQFFTDTLKYVWQFPPELRQRVKDGDIYQINETPINILRAIRDDKSYLFNDDAVFHFKNANVSGTTDGGWSFPDTLVNFRNLYQLQVYRKIDEVVGRDYMLPFRVFSPPQQTDVNSAISNSINRAWSSHVKKAIDVRRRDKYAMFAFPFPVNYQEFGADGKSLAPKDLIEYQNNHLLDSLGYPAELFRASLQIQQMPTAIRLFENSFWFIHNGFNRFLNWVAKSLANFQEKEFIKVRLERPSVADDIDRQNVILQLGMQGEIPRSYYMGALGISDPVSSKRERMEEDLEIAKMEQEKQVEFEMAMQASQVQGTTPAEQGDDPGNTEGISPQDIEEQAAIKADEWLSMDEGTRRKDMDATKGHNFNLYSMAKEIMEQKRRQGASEGRQQVYQQQ